MEVLVNMPVGDFLLSTNDHDMYKESSWGENVSVLIEQRHMSVSCVGAQSGSSQWSEKGEYEELVVQSVNWVVYARPEKGEFLPLFIYKVWKTILQISTASC